MIIEFYKKQVYGKDTFYIKDPKTAKTVQNLTGKKTVDQSDFSNFVNLGITFVQVMN